MLRKSEVKKAEVVEDLWEQATVDALFVQYSCLDRVGHELNNYARRGIPYEHARVLKMYDWFDEVLLPRLLKVKAEYLVLVSDHGWVSLDEATNPAGSGTAMVWGKHGKDGILALVGPDIPPGIHVDCRNIDVLPTVLEALDLPIPAGGGRSVLVRQSELDEINMHLVGLGYIDGAGRT
jgi:predicted AlkP superfamily phosphohydrolase/phosphomutase